MEPVISTDNVSCNQNGFSNKETTVDPFKALMASARSEGHPITSALARLQNEMCYFSCRPLGDPESIEDVVKLGGLDFKAGDIATTAMRDFGVSPRAIYDWCESLALGLARGWKDEPRAERLLEGVTDREQTLLKRIDHDEKIDGEQVRAFELIGLARLLLAEGAPRVVFDYVMNFNLDKGYEASKIVQLANSVLSFAWEFLTGEEDQLEMVEMHVRGIMRQVTAVEAITGDVVDHAIRLEALAVWCAQHAHQRRSPARAVLSGESVDYAKALQDMQEHPEARYADEDRVIYAWVDGHLMHGVDRDTPLTRNENSEESNSEMRWKRVDPCTLSEMRAFAAAHSELEAAE